MTAHACGLRRDWRCSGRTGARRYWRIPAQCRVVTIASQEAILRQGASNDQVHFLHLRPGAPVFRRGRDSVAADRDQGRANVRRDVGDRRIAGLGLHRCRGALPHSAASGFRVLVACRHRAGHRPGGHALDHRPHSIRFEGIVAGDAGSYPARSTGTGIAPRARRSRWACCAGPNPWFPDRRDFTICASIEPAKAVGGDFYDAFLLDPDHLLLAIGDVAGKGVSAALFMVRALTLLRSAAVNWVSLADTVRGVNRTLADDNEASMFLTLFMAVLDLRSGVLDYVNFGHLPPLIRSLDGSVACHEVTPGVMFGLLEHAEGAAGSVVLMPGSTLVLYSDGVTEAEAPDQLQFGLNGLLEAARQAADAGTGRRHRTNRRSGHQPCRRRGTGRRHHDPCRDVQRKPHRGLNWRSRCGAVSGMNPW